MLKRRCHRIPGGWTIIAAATGFCLLLFHKLPPAARLQSCQLSTKRTCPGCWNSAQVLALCSMARAMLRVSRQYVPTPVALLTTWSSAIVNLYSLQASQGLVPPSLGPSAAAVLGGSTGRSTAMHCVVRRPGTAAGAAAVGSSAPAASLQRPNGR